MERTESSLVNQLSVIQHFFGPDSKADDSVKRANVGFEGL
jgi:hypothetical protein